MVLSLTGILFPQYQGEVNTNFQPAIIGEIVFMLWLLIKGARPQEGEAAASSFAVA